MRQTVANGDWHGPGTGCKTVSFDTQDEEVGDTGAITGTFVGLGYWGVKTDMGLFAVGWRERRISAGAVTAALGARGEIGVASGGAVAKILVE